jgi:hypothetical protein
VGGAGIVCFVAALSVLVVLVRRRPSQRVSAAPDPSQWTPESWTYETWRHNDPPPPAPGP